MDRYFMNIMDQYVDLMDCWIAKLGNEGFKRSVNEYYSGKYTDGKSLRGGKVLREVIPYATKKGIGKDIYCETGIKLVWKELWLYEDQIEALIKEK